MNKIILFEMKKQFKNRNMLIILLAIFILMFFWIRGNSKIDTFINTEFDNQIDIEIKEIKDEIISLGKNSNIIDVLNELVDVLNIKKTSIKIDNKEYINAEISYNKLKLKLVDYNYLEENKRVEIQNKIEEYEELERLNIQPINKDYSMKALNFLRLSLDPPFTIIISLVVFYLIANSISGEFEKNTYKLIFLQPIKQSNILFAKIISVFILSLLSIALTLTVFFVYLVIKHGLGSLDYPIRIIFNNVTTFVPIYKFVILGFLILIIYIAFLIVFSTIISVMESTINNSIAFCSIISISMYIIIFKFNFGSLLSLNSPFSLYQVSYVLSGGLSYKYSISNYNINNNILITIILLIILLITNIFLINKRHLNK